MNSASSQPTLAARLDEEEVKVRKFQILFGPWWQHYVAPYELRWSLLAERTECPYCSGPLQRPPEEIEGTDQRSLPAHIDHMDPLSRGGEESIRNAIYACAGCNFAKGSRLFVDWLEILSPANQAIAREIYTSRHGHPPEAFRPGPRVPRQMLPRVELAFDETVLRRLFPKPIVQGPPARAPTPHA